MKEETKIELQKRYCRVNNRPFFLTDDGYCVDCGKIVEEEEPYFYRVWNGEGGFIK